MLNIEHQAVTAGVMLVQHLLRRFEVTVGMLFEHLLWCFEVTVVMMVVQLLLTNFFVANIG